MRRLLILVLITFTLTTALVGAALYALTPTTADASFPAKPTKTADSDPSPSTGDTNSRSDQPGKNHASTQGITHGNPNPVNTGVPVVVPTAGPTPGSTAIPTDVSPTVAPTVVNPTGAPTSVARPTKPSGESAGPGCTLCCPVIGVTVDATSFTLGQSKGYKVTIGGVTHTVVIKHVGLKEAEAAKVDGSASCAATGCPGIGVTFDVTGLKPGDAKAFLVSIDSQKYWTVVEAVTVD